MSGVQGLGSGNNFPLSFPQGGGGAIFNLQQASEEENITFEPSPDFLQLSTPAAIDLPKGELSLFDWSQIVADTIRKLRESLHQSAYIDSDISRQFYEAAFIEMGDLITEQNKITAAVSNWNNDLKQHGGNGAITSSATLNQNATSFNNQLTSTVNSDSTNIQSVNAILSTVDTQQKINNLVQNTYGGDEQALADYLNSALASWNAYMSSRPDLSAASSGIASNASTYNSQVSDFNGTVSTINSERQDLGLSTLPGLQSSANVSSNPSSYISYNNALHAIPTVTVPISPLSTFPVPNLSQDPTLVTVPPPVTNSTLPRATYSESLNVLFLTFANNTFLAIHGLLKSIDLSKALTDTENAFFIKFGLDITAPTGFLRSVQKEFLDSSGDVGLSTLAMGLYSRNLEIALSSAIYRAVAQKLSIPISSRLFASLQFTASELLFRSALVSALPAAKFILSRLGTLGGISPAIDVAISEALVIQVNGIVGSGILYNQVNNLLKQEFLAQGAQSLDGLESFTKAVTATLSLSILSVALAQLGRAIGMPNMVAQLFAQAGGIPTSEALVALTAGSRLSDVLDNPISILNLKQNLTDKLVFERGYTSDNAAGAVNGAINNILLNGNSNTFSQLKADLLNEFNQSGFSAFEAHMLTNETLGLIRGDLGVQFLNATFGLNFDPSVIASSVANNLLGIDAGLAGAMLSNSVNRAMLYGGLGPTEKLQTELIAELQRMGLTSDQATQTSNQALALVETAGLLAPLNEYPGVIDIILGGPMLQAAAYGQPVVAEEISQNLQKAGVPQTQADIIAEQAASFTSGNFSPPENLFSVALELAIVRSTGHIFQTQREFRNRLADELRSVGFNLNDALYLANSAALFGLNGGLTSPYGGTSARIAAIGDSVVSRLSVDYGISTTLAADMYNQAREQAILQGPYSSEDQYKAVLTEAIHKGVQNQLGSNEGYQIVDRAIADLASPEGILGLSGLTEQLSAHIIGVLKPDLGARLADENKNQILTALIGGNTIEKIESEEKKDPLSALNLIAKQVDTLTKDQDEEETRRMIRKLIQLLESLLKPNAEIGFVLQSLMDHPSTFIGSLLVQKPKGEFLDIPI